jgi:flagellin
MSVSIQTNVNSLVAQENLRVTNEFQSTTIKRLTSGYRINSSGDDAAGLAVANKFRSDVAELTQGVRNANDAISTLQLVDGGLNNISKLIDRMKTLASQSASGTFTGNRTTLNNEYQALLTEINRQAANIGMNNGGTNNQVLGIYIGGGSTQANAQVSVDLSGSANQVDTSALGLANTAISGGGTALAGNSIRLDNPALSFLNGSDTQAFTFRIFNGSASQNVTITVTGSASGISGTEVLNQLNTGLASYGISASTVGSGADVGELQFGGSRAFSVTVAAPAGAGQAVATASSTAINSGNYNYNVAVGSFVAVTGGNETVTFTNASGSANVNFSTTTGNTVANAISAINAQTASLGIYAVLDAAGTGFSIQSNSTFTLVKTAAATTGEVITGAVGAKTITAPAAGASSTANALSALTAITSAVSTLGSVQGKVGTGQNKLSYAIQLAQSQIASFSAAESRIRDADIAAEAANLTKAQVLEQANLAAMSQANSSPQSVLALLK